MVSPGPWDDCGGVRTQLCFSGHFGQLEMLALFIIHQMSPFLGNGHSVTTPLYVLIILHLMDQTVVLHRRCLKSLATLAGLKGALRKGSAEQTLSSSLSGCQGKLPLLTVSANY